MNKMRPPMQNNLIATFVFLLHLQFSAQNYTYDIKHLSVPLDHFNFRNNATFKLRYLINDTHWNCDGPIFFYTGNEGNIESFAQNTGFMWEIAAEFRALLVFAEHRYYGESLPFGNLSYSDPKYLGYLSSSQALADFVYLIDYLQRNNSYYTNGERNPVIAFGGSYGGMLSAWIRMKYPASVHGAIAASAPVWQFQGITPCEIFNRIVTTVFSVSSMHDCSKVIKKSWAAIREVTSTADGRSWLSSKWKLCNRLQNSKDVETLINWLTEIYSNLAMMNYPYPTNFIAALPGHPVKAFCNKIHTVPSKARPVLEQLGRALSVYTNYTDNVKCVNITESTNLGEEGWDFQACTEMIMPMCSNNNDMFENESWNFTKYSEECYQKWKVGATRSDLAILEYGGKDLESASNIVFSNGLLDPWSGGGVLHNISKTVVAILIPEAAHHLDLRASNLADPHSVIAARNFHKHAIRGWLHSYYRERLNTYYK